MELALNFIQGLGKNEFQTMYLNGQLETKTKLLHDFTVWIVVAQFKD